jgi:hypothetical protein
LHIDQKILSEKKCPESQQQQHSVIAGWSAVLALLGSVLLLFLKLALHKALHQLVHQLPTKTKQKKDWVPLVL